MSNSEYQTNLYQNGIYTPRQIQSSFQPLPVNPPNYPAQIVPPLPLIDMSQLQQQDVNQSTSVTNGTTTTSFIYDLKKYKYDYFISNPSSPPGRDYGKFASPTGICTLDDDRFLVANFERDSLLLLDINGIAYEIYTDLPTPKDVLYYSSNPSQAVVATRKQLVILDLNTKQIVARSQLPGFYPWNIQYLKESGVFAACDPSGERIVFFDKDLVTIGDLSLYEPNPDLTQAYKKVYPYAAYFFPDNTSYVLTHRENQCQLREYDIPTTSLKKIFNSPSTFLSYSIYADSTRKCLIADKVNHRLLSIDKDSIVEEYKSKSIQEPYSMTFLSDGTLCVTDWNKSYGTNGGVAIISEIDLKANQ